MTKPTLPSLAGLTTGDAEWFDQVAAGKRAAAAATRDPAQAAQLDAEAAGIEALAAAVRDPAARGLPILHEGQGGETAPPEDCDMPWHVRELAQVVAVEPAMLAADASLDRLKLARNAGVLNLAVEAAENARAQTAVEKMLAHQLAAGHALTMELLAAASNDLHRYQKARDLNLSALADAARSGAVAARLMGACAQGTLALDRLRNGGRQVITVQHVTVADGGQAVVAGNVTTPEPSR
jgi:hypothetical protein